MDGNQSLTSKQLSKNIKTTTLPIKKPTSLSTLIMWNVSKALEQNPTLNVKDSIKIAQTRLERDSDVPSVQDIVFDKPYERHLACALLAWQQLGHQDADSLCRFVENKTVSSKKEVSSELPSETKFFNKGSLARNSGEFSYGFFPDIFPINRESEIFRDKESKAPCLNSSAMGPVVMLPVETKVVMRLENTGRSGLRGANGAGGAGGGHAKSPKSPEVDTLNKIDQVCCLDKECADRLAALDATTNELRQRASKLARREAERVELVERAEAAWKDLEVGFQRRLALAAEKEEDIAKQISRMLEERIAYKNSCTTLSQELKEKTSKTEKDRIRLKDIERVVCERACTRLKLSEETARGDEETAQQATRAMQLDRDLLYKQEQLRRNTVNLQSEIQSARVLTSEAERATRVELTALRDQMAEISNNLLDEDARNAKIKAEISGLRAEKMELLVDLEGCKAQCDSHMQGRMVELGKKREALSTLREKVMDCKCKVPVDESVEVKRTPSLAALCTCTPEDKLLESCSCTSMRSILLSNLFSELFGGLQSELIGSVTQMPCQLLKCLEDNHNWDRSSAIKSHLKNYFSNLLSGELDIAIATSIENYHAKWVGMSCADAVKMKPGPEDNTEYEGWEQRAVERRAQQLATELAEQLFQEREEELTKRAREIVHSGPPPCECNVKAKMPEGCHCAKTETLRPVLHLPDTPVYWHQAIQDVTQLKMQVEDLKKDSIKKDDLKTMEDKFEKFIQLTSGGVPPEQATNELVAVKAPKKSPAKAVPLRAGKKGSGSVKNGLGKWTLAVNTHEAPAFANAPVCLQQQDVTKLRLQDVNVKKDAINGEDLMKIQDQIARIIRRRSGIIGTNYLKNKYGNTGNEQFSKTNRAVNHLQYSDTNKTTKKKNLESKIKSHLIRGIKKPYKKNSETYAVNMCLCSTNHHQQCKLDDTNKLETNVWKQTISKEGMSQISSTTKQAKPINNCFFSQDDSVKTFMNNESYERICPANCVCFHNIPSNTSIDKLLETLAKWKGDLDSTLAFESFRGDPKVTGNKPHVSHDGFVSFKSNTSLYSPGDNSHKNNDLCLSNEKCVLKSSTKSTELIVPTDSVYMGAVNLDKSIDEVGKSANQCNKSPYLCSTNKCNCARILEAGKIESKISNVKKEKHKGPSAIKIKKERRVKEIVVVDNIPKLKEKINDKTLDKEANTEVKQVNNKMTDVHPIEALDYQIKYLGVSLVDVNSSAGNKVTLENDGYCYKNMTKNVEGCSTDNIKKQYEHCQQGYSAKRCHPLPEYSKGTNRIKKLNNFITKVGQNDYSRYLTNNANKHIETLNDDIASTNFKLQSEMLSSIEKNKSNDKSQVNKSYKKGNLDSKFSCDQFKTNEISYIHKFEKSYRKIIPNIHSEENILKSTCNMTSEYFQRVNKTSNSQTEALNHIQDSSENTTCTQINGYAPEPQLFPYECSKKIDDFKQFIDKNLATFAVNNDAVTDVQNSECFQSRDESCVCCKKYYDDDCRDLEDNTFHLLEQYLKNKLCEFKALPCSSICIPSEEEEKIFSTIVQKVKRLISESTNKVVCKCSLNEGKSQGSWNRAYGLLQEYLKIKINKIHCSCLLTEDNKDSILPEVLEKIFNLIEYDFQRLKKMCCCNFPNELRNENIISMENNCEMEVSSKDPNALVASKRSYSNFAEIAVNTIFFSPMDCLQQCKMPQLSITLNAEEKICKTDISRNLDKDFSTCPLHKHENCNSSSPAADHELSKSSELIYSDTADEKKNYEDFIHGQYKSQITKHVALNSNECDFSVKINSETISSKETDDVKGKQSSVRSTEELYNSEEAVELAVKYKETTSNPTKDDTIHTKYLKLKQKYLSSCNSDCDQKNTVLIEKKIENYKDSKLILDEPYISDTKDCTCDNSKEAHVCSKSITNLYPAVIDNIFTKTAPDKTSPKNLFTTLPKQLSQNIDPKVALDGVPKEVIMPGILKICGASHNLSVSEATCCKKVRKLVLKHSPMDNIVKSHAGTNTFEDIASVDSDCSVTEDTLEGCEYSSQIVCNKQNDTDQLKRSITFPSPVKNDKHLKGDNMPMTNCSLTINRLPKHVCNCEKVPLCHVKMLVENIESKLANTNCICDSMIPNVCPVHSTMC